MHTIGATHTTFEITVDGRPASLAEVMPGLGEHDRLGVVVRSALGGIGSSALMLAMVHEFYATHEAEVQALGPGEILYPEHYVFHIGRARGDYAWLDVWPAHKEVVVADSREAIIQSLLDHGITRLLVEDVDRPPNSIVGHPGLEQQVVTCLAFSPTGRTARADVHIASNPSAEQWVAWTIDPERAALESDRPSAQSSDRLLRVAEVTAAERDAARLARTNLIEDSVPCETYRRISASEAVNSLR